MKIPEPLKEKMHEYSSKRLDHGDGSSSYITDKRCVIEEDIKSAVSGLIKFHEDEIEKLKKNIEDNPEPNGMYEFNRICDEERIKREKESIKAIEHWLEDVI